MATKMSAAARETKNRFWGPLSERLVNTAMMTRILPTIVKTIIRVMAVANAAVASGEYGASLSKLWLQVGEEVPPVLLMLLPGRPAPAKHAVSMTAKARPPTCKWTAPLKPQANSCLF